jgi:hypothetical protein
MAGAEYSCGQTTAALSLWLWNVGCGQSAADGQLQTVSCRRSAADGQLRTISCGGMVAFVRRWTKNFVIFDLFALLAFGLDN